MHINLVKRYIAFVACALFPSIALSQSAGCHLVSESDGQFGALVREQRAFLPKAAGVAICEGQISSGWPFIVSKIALVHSLKSYDLDSPYFYKMQLPATAKFQKYMEVPPLDEYAEGRVTMVCLEQQHCNDFFDAGFVPVGSEIAPETYEILAELWNDGQIETMLLEFLALKNEEHARLLDALKNGKHMEPSGVSGHSSNGKMVGVTLSMYLNNANEEGIWLVDIDISGESPKIMSVYLLGDF